MAQLKAMGLTIERFYDPELGIVIGAFGVVIVMSVRLVRAAWNNNISELRDAAHAAGTSESLGLINNHLVAGGQLPLTRTGNSGFHRRKDATDARTQSQ
jgi:ABC-type sulfate transport system permease component